MGMTPETDRRRHMLFLAHLLPYPPDGGASIRTYNIMRLLSREFSITALCFFRQRTRPTAESVSAGVRGLSAFARVEAWPIPQEHSRPRLVWDHVRSLLRRRVYTRFAHESSGFADCVRRAVGDQPVDLVHLDSLDLSVYLEHPWKAPVVCSHHNVESSLLRRRAAGVKGVASRMYLNYQANRMEEEERRWLERCSLNVAVSDADRARFLEIAPRSKFIVVPNGVDTTAFKPEQSEQSGVVFVGGYNWLPNRDALDHFCSEILPLLRRRRPSLPVEWVGRAPADVRERYARRYGVRLSGYVDDIRSYVGRAACYVVPIRVGGGTRLKILDAWAMGKAVVSTSVGCEGLAARDGENILIRDEPTAFAAAVEQVIEDDSLRRRLGDRARRTVEDGYDWEVIAQPMLRAYRELVEVKDS